MLYYLFEYLSKFDFPGAGLFNYISFRSAIAILSSLIFSTVFGKKVILMLQKKLVGETVRDLGLAGQYEKQGTPTMGGLIIIGSILIPVLLFAKLDNVYILLMIITTLWLGLIGFTDDYIKVFRKNKKGLSGKVKMLGQIILGLIVGLTLYMSDGVVIRDKIEISDFISKDAICKITNKDDCSNVKIIANISGQQKLMFDNEVNIIDKITRNEILSQIDASEYEKIQMKVYAIIDHKSTMTTIPFFKDNEFDYSSLVGFLGDFAKTASWIIFVMVVIFIITAVSNGANITDGLDGLATGSSAIMISTLAILAYVSGNRIFADYLNIMYIPQIGELVIFSSAAIGATIGFMWYNTYPAQVFMGDTGSLTLGGIIAVMAIIIRKELLIPILCGIFLIENISVIMQVSYFKYTKKRFGEGRRIFKMSPLHHHFQKLGYPEPKIVMRFMIIGILLAVITIITLKLR